MLRFAKSAAAQGGEKLLTPPRTQQATPYRETANQMANGKAKCASCKDCYFGQNGLCALNLAEACPTFRPADRGLRPERQLAFVFRAERTHAAYAFPQPR